MINLDYRVSTQMCRLRNVFIRMFAHYKTSLHTFFTYEGMSMRNI